MLVHNALLALLDRAPVQRDAGGVLQAEFRAFFHVVVDFGIEQQGLGGNAADVQARPAQLVVFLDESGLSVPTARREWPRCIRQVRCR